MDPKLKLEVLEKTTILVTASLGLVAALAWNEAIQSLFKQIFGQASSLWAMFLYAIAITIVVVFLTLKLTQLAGRAKEKLDKDNKISE